VILQQSKRITVYCHLTTGQLITVNN